MTSYLPGSQTENWCLLEPSLTRNCFKGGLESTFKNIKISDTFAFIAPGRILPWVEDLSTEIIEKMEGPISLRLLGQKPQDFLINPLSDCSAKGELIYDDGVTPDLNKHTNIFFSLEGKPGNLTFTVHVNTDKAPPRPTDDKMRVMGSLIFTSAK